MMAEVDGGKGALAEALAIRHVVPDVESLVLLHTCVAGARVRSNASCSEKKMRGDGWMDASRCRGLEMELDKRKRK